MRPHEIRKNALCIQYVLFISLAVATGIFYLIVGQWKVIVAWFGITELLLAVTSIALYIAKKNTGRFIAQILLTMIQFAPITAVFFSKHLSMRAWYLCVHTICLILGGTQLVFDVKSSKQK